MEQLPEIIAIVAIVSWILSIIGYDAHQQDPQEDRLTPDREAITNAPTRPNRQEASITDNSKKTTQENRPVIKPKKSFWKCRLEMGKSVLSWMSSHGRRTSAQKPELRLTQANLDLNDQTLRKQAAAAK